MQVVIGEIGVFKGHLNNKMMNSQILTNIHLQVQAYDGRNADLFSQRGAKNF